MYIEDRLNSIEAKIDFLVKSLGNAIPEGESGIAGAGAEPVVAQQVSQAIAAAGVTTQTKPRGRGRPPKTEAVETPNPAPPGGTPSAVLPLVQPVVQAAPQPDPFALEGTPSQPVIVRTLDEVRAALAVFQASNSQADALKLFKDVTKVENMTQLAKAAEADKSLLGKLFKAAIPADKLALTDVRVVLVAANSRKNGSGMEVLTKYKAADITKLEEKDFVVAILDAHKVQ